MRFVLIALLLVFAGNAYAAETKHDRKFDPDAIAAKLAKKHKGVAAQTASAPKPWIYDFASQVRSCWKRPDVQVIPAISFVVRFRSDGSLDGEPVIENPVDSADFRNAAATALAAIKNCSPFRLPADQYDNWKIFVAEFKNEL